MNMGSAVYAGSSSVVSMELRWVRRSNGGSDDTSRNPGNFKELNAASTLPIYISTTKKDVNLQELRDLYLHCNHSCNRLPNGSIKEIMDMKKLCTAISHSAVVVSVFCKSHLIDVSLSSSLSPSDIGKGNKVVSPLRGVFRDVLPVTPSNGQLVGFGRAVSDCELTASIYDVMVIPSLQRMGIGKIIIRRIIRLLTSRDIYDIAALCSERERLFFNACGFGEDMLGSTTMMYRKSLEQITDAEKSIESSRITD
ncbi:PREDICTED: uncharacterized N-acetyltransferase ycf52 [Tarenaya hassleriana]|uniref:uncharacterized N-acetyltransferase ycf52 n=1 Tax=Tarenaya hassleriana TaxID=28532 RepID=UPI00053C9C49|nr:PREDICTED: uncharacterized N-acetyltransferase ycf52 [Tarenaya hassleriana]XP_010536766.1 PREDICTED: uncharacterized N-acetyltransferase ycf52 [Tarenaya hassleriana]XP_010536774.1 PREDICTED: uncharacterized N-acetyltransferase ycf52 [Tarenaya hassleriana]XP_010536781.1 PREDICTED: uncharacterized N-acetyltransferase ycf52 [Tarenaya hassleriana]